MPHPPQTHSRCERRPVPAHWDDRVGVLVAGLGSAGACAAIEAARAGARVLVAEKASFGGGTTSMSGGVLYCGGGTELQRSCGFEDSVDDMRAYLMAACGPEPDEAKIDLYCRGSVAHFDWLVSLGIPFKPRFWPEYVEPSTDDGLYYSGCEHTHPFSSIARPAPRGHVVQAEGSAGDPTTINAGRIMMDRLEEGARQAGAEFLFEAELTALVTGDDGVIAGAVLEVGGEERWVSVSGGVVLTTGGFVGNREMLRRYAPRGLDLLPLAGAHDNGDGIRLGQAVGADAIHMDALAFMCPVLEPHSFVQGILFNAQGERFVTEDANHKRIAERCLVGQRGRMYLLVDDAIFRKPRYPKELIAVADSIEALEKELEFLPSGALQRTVEAYNTNATRGTDPILGKLPENLRPLDRPPFGVFDCSLGGEQPFMTLTLGGLRTATTGEVLDPQGRTIPGLYAAGRTTSCLSANNCFTSGIQLGEGTFFGRLAGRSAALRSTLSLPHGTRTFAVP